MNSQPLHHLCTPGMINPHARMERKDGGCSLEAWHKHLPGKQQVLSSIPGTGKMKRIERKLSVAVPAWNPLTPGG